MVRKLNNFEGAKNPGFPTGKKKSSNGDFEFERKIISPCTGGFEFERKNPYMDVPCTGVFEFERKKL